MLWIGHLVVTWLYFQRVTIWALAPDVPMMLFLTPGNTPWSVKKEWYLYSFFYKIPHSLLVLWFIPERQRSVYAFHILCDILSHTGKWSIQPLYPLPFRVHGIWDPIEWN
ncbi:hypothetical protein EBT25_09560 [bacterium]|jgi:hypothetical protein|nr:hypothetical protein [bacterium]